MYARCIHCNTVFKISTAQLEAAEGVVRCGMCHQPFNAIESLQETLDSDTTENLSSGNLVKSADFIEKIIKKSWFSGKLSSTVSKITEPLEQQDEAPTKGTMKSHVFTVVGGIDHIWEDSSTTPEMLLKPSKEEPPKNLTTDIEPAKSDKPPKKSAIAAQLIKDLETPLPEILEIESTILPDTHISTEDIVKPLTPPNNDNSLIKKHVKQLSIWAICYLIALSVLGIQTIYFLRSNLAKHNEIRPALEIMCSITNCKLPPRQSPQDIKIVNRQLSLHPQQTGAILVNATILNIAEHPVAYPIVEIKFFGYSGGVIGKRQFLPIEYMENKKLADLTIPSEEMIDIALEIISPGNETDSFEITFF